MKTFPLCKKCKVSMTRSTALTNTPRMGAPDFIEQPHRTQARVYAAINTGQTMSMDGPCAITPVWKCPKCGHSIGR